MWKNQSFTAWIWIHLSSIAEADVEETHHSSPQNLQTIYNTNMLSTQGMFLNGQQSN